MLGGCGIYFVGIIALLNGMGTWCFLFEGKERVWFGFVDMNLGVWLLCGQGGGSIGVIFWWW